MTTPTVWKGEPVRLTMSGGATQVWAGNQQSPPILIYNFDPVNTVYVGYSNSIAVGGINTQMVPPQFGLTMDGTRTLYAVGITGAGPLQVTPGGGAPFQQSTLNGLGGVGIYTTVTAPTQPPTIPVNSLWFAPDGSIRVWNGATWVPYQFNAQDIIQAGTIIANLIAAGTIVAGIVNGTAIIGSVLIIHNAFGAIILTINQSTGTWLQYQDMGSAVQGPLIASSAAMAGTDILGNAYLAGLWTYSNVGGVFYAMGLQGETIAWQSATSAAGPYSVLTSITTALIGNLSRPTITIDAMEVVFGAGSSAFWDDNAQSLGLPLNGGPFVPNQGWNGIAGGLNLSGVFRAKLLPWASTWLDISATYNATTTVVGSPIGSFPSAPYYPSAPRQFPMSITGTVSSAANWPRVFVGTSGALQITVPAMNAVGSVLSCSVMFPTN